MFSVHSKNRARLRARFEEDMLSHMNLLYNKALQLTNNEHDASDLVQDTYARAYRYYERFRPGTNAKAWLFKILFSVFVTGYRKKKGEPEMLSLEDWDKRFDACVDGVPSNFYQDFTKYFESDGSEPEIRDALAALPSAYRATVLLIDVDGFSYEEAAVVLDCPIGTVRSRVFRARKILFVSLWEFACKRGYAKKD